MQLRHVRYFVATADAGTVSAAAARVHVTQPALSRQLRQLEHDLGVDLFDRAAGRLSLSRIGRELLPIARALLDGSEALESAARFYAHGGVERIRVAAPTVTLTDLVSPFVAEMSPDEPVVDVRPSDGMSIADMLQNGADLAIGTQRPHSPYQHRTLAAMAVWGYVRPDDPWSTRTSVTLEELLTRALVVLPQTFTAREALDTALGSAGVKYGEALEAANGTIAQALAAVGRGIAVVSDDPRHGLARFRIDAPDGPLRIQLVAGWDPQTVAAATMEELVERFGAWIDLRYGQDL